MAIEAAALQVGAAAGVPVAEVVAAGSDPADLGASYLILRYVEGQTIARKILRDDEFAAARRVLPAQLGRALGAARRIRPRWQISSTPISSSSTATCSTSPASPAFELAFRWLEANRPDCDRRPSCTATSGSGTSSSAPTASEPSSTGSSSTAAIRWRISVGSACGLGGSAGRSRWPVSATTTSSSPRTARPRASGRPRRRALVGGARHPQVGDHVHHAGERAPHRDGAQPRAGGDRPAGVRERTRPSAAVAVMGAPHDSPHRRPSCSRRCGNGSSDVVGGTTGRMQFHGRVAVNVWRWSSGSSKLGPDQARAHRERLSSLGVSDDAELAAHGRAGDLDDRLDEVRAVVWATVQTSSPSPTALRGVNV